MDQTKRAKKKKKKKNREMEKLKFPKLAIILNPKLVSYNLRQCREKS